jgi:preprotein translocase subunit YajC
MNPSAFLNSFTGLAAVVLIFLPATLVVIALLALFLALINRRHKERMKMIEQGMVPAPPPKRTGNYYPLLIVGSIFTAFGLALFCTELVSRGGDFEGGVIFGFIGLAQIACFIIIRLMRKRDNASLPPTSGGQPGN